MTWKELAVSINALPEHLQDEPVTCFDQFMLDFHEYKNVSYIRGEHDLLTDGCLYLSNNVLLNDEDED